MSSQIPATEPQLRASSKRLRGSADMLPAGNDALLLRFYGVECLMKAIYISRQLPPQGATAVTTDILTAGKVFGQSGHDLDRGLGALALPNGTLGAAPKLKRPPAQPVPIVQAHQVWRYGIDHTVNDDVLNWLKTAETVLDKL